MATIVNTFQDKRSQLLGGGLSNAVGGFAEEAQKIIKRKRAADAIKNGDFNTIENILSDPNIDDASRTLLASAMNARKDRAQRAAQNQAQNRLAQERISVSRERISSEEKRAADQRAFQASENQKDRSARARERKLDRQARTAIAQGKLKDVKMVVGGGPGAKALMKSHPDLPLDNLVKGQPYELEFSGGKLSGVKAVGKVPEKSTSEFDKKSAGKDADRRNAALESARTAGGVLQNLEGLGNIISSGNIQTGSFRPLITSLQGYASDVGVDIGGIAQRAGVDLGTLSTSQEFDRLSKQLTIEVVQKFSGALSNKELDFASDSVTSLGKGPMANIIAISAMSAVAETARERAADLSVRESKAEDKQSAFLEWETENNSRDVGDIKQRTSEKVFESLQKMGPQNLKALFDKVGASEFSKAIKPYLNDDQLRALITGN